MKGDVPSRAGRRRAGRWIRGILVVCAFTGAAEPVLAQNFFERLFRPQQPQQQPQVPMAPPPFQQQAPRPQQRRPAAQPGQPQAPPGQQAAPQPEPPPPPYEKELLRLSEIIGSLAFLRSLCSMPDAPEWPRRMQALLEAEGVTAGRRERIAGAYNRGYGAFGLTYRVCTPSATEATNRYLREGDQIARNLSTRYGG